MLKKVLTHVIRMKNPRFCFDPAVTSLVLWELAWEKLRMWLRGQRLLLLGRRSGGLFLGKNVRLRNLPNIRFGNWVQLEDSVLISALGKRPVSLGHKVRIGAYSRLVTSSTLGQIGSHIRIGDHVGIGEFAYLGGAGGLDIGDHCIIGQYFSCHPENHVFEDTRELIRLQPTTRRGIQIGRNCWVGAKVTILDGVHIGDHCVIAAGAVVNRSMPAYSVIGGVPAKVIRSTFEHSKNAYAAYPEMTV